MIRQTFFGKKIITMVLRKQLISLYSFLWISKYSLKSFTINNVSMVHITINTTKCEHCQKPALSSEVREKRNKPRNCKVRLHVGFESATYCNHEILSLTLYPSTQPRKLNNRQILVTHKTATYALKKCQAIQQKWHQNQIDSNFQVKIWNTTN